MSVSGGWRTGIMCAAVMALATTAAYGSLPRVSPGRPVTNLAVFHGVVSASMIPEETSRDIIQRPRPMLNITGYSAKKIAQLKQIARTHAPMPNGFPAFIPGAGGDSPFLSVPKKFTALADSATICPYFGGCEPPDGAMAVNSSFEMEGVNTSFAVFNTLGTKLAGWPKNATKFFGIPAPSPAGCDPAGPFESDPRIFYDTNDKRWFVTILQVEGPNVIGTPCNDVSLYWVAVSQTSDPNGSWFIYSFDMSLGSGNWADFTQTGYDEKQFCFTGNMFPFSGGGFAYAEYLCASKPTMETGASVSYGGFVGPTISGKFLDTVQPVKTQGSVLSQPGVEYFVSSENIFFGGGACSTGCSTWAIIDIIDAGGVGITTVSVPGYSVPPNADQPACSACIDTDDPRISGTPVYRAGTIWAALNTGVNNGSQVVSGVLWGQLIPTLDSTNHVVSAFFFQGNYVFFSGDVSAYYGGLAADENNNMVMVFDYSSSGTNPSTYALSRRVGDGLSSFRCCALLQGGATSTFDFRWGDYTSGASNEDPSDNMWVQGEYSRSSGDWGTAIAKIKP